jgi:hypothetical protein
MIDFATTFAGRTVFNDSLYLSTNGDSVRFETIKYYITNVRLLKESRIVFEENKVHLVDNLDTASQRWRLALPRDIRYDAIALDFGIDSATNVAGALGGDLDPTKGMYWAWQSGYINCKLEGTTSQGIGQNKQFQTHLGGYKGDTYALQSVVLPTRHRDRISIALRLDTFITQLTTGNTYRIMSPSKTAVLLSKTIASCFTIIDP